MCRALCLFLSFFLYHLFSSGKFNSNQSKWISSSDGWMDGSECWDKEIIDPSNEAQAMSKRKI